MWCNFSPWNYTTIVYVELHSLTLRQSTYVGIGVVTEEPYLKSRANRVIPSTLVCGIKLHVRISCLFTHANCLMLKPNHKKL